MRRRTDRGARRGRGNLVSLLLAEVTSDPWRKLAALTLAVGMWYWLDLQVSAEEDVELKLVPIDVRADSLDRPRPDVLLVRYPPKRFAILEMRDPSTQERVDEVVLDLNGPKYLIETLRENLGYAVTLDLSAAPERGSFNTTIDIDSIRPLSPQYKPLLDTGLMRPAQVEFVLEPVVREQVPINPGAVRVVEPDPQRHPGFMARLMTDAATFDPAVVTVFGPGSAVARLRNRDRVFQVDFERSGRIDDTRASGELELIGFEGVERIVLSRQPQAVYPLRPDFEDFEMEVPVLLDVLGLPERLRPQYHAVEASATISLNVSGTLEALLADKSRAELDEWARRWARLVASVTPMTGPPRDRLVIEPHLLLLDRTYREELDYRLTSAPPVTVERRAPR